MARTRETHKVIKSSSRTREESPWIALVFGVILIFAAFFIYDFLTGLELTGGSSATFDSLIGILSYIKFKYIVSILIGALGVFHIYISTQKLRHKEEEKE